jgi:hypothetical protein
MSVANTGALQVVDPPHTPAVQTSPWVQVFPSLHEVPLVTVGLVQRPVVESQVPGA